MAIFLASDVMGFAGLLLAYAVLRVRAPAWPDPALRFDRVLAGGLTLVLLASGATVNVAVVAARADRITARRWLLVTALLGAIFVVGQGVEFRALVTAHHLGLAADHAASTFYVLAGFHGLHVVAGVLLLLGVARRAGREAIEVAALYWQFVDLVWIVIFTVVYLLPAVPGAAARVTALLGLAAAAVALSLRQALKGLDTSRALRAAVVVPIVFSIAVTVVLMLDAHVRGGGLVR